MHGTRRVKRCTPTAYHLFAVTIALATNLCAAEELTHATQNQSRDIAFFLKFEGDYRFSELTFASFTILSFFLETEIAGEYFVMPEIPVLSLVIW